MRLSTLCLSSTLLCGTALADDAAPATNSAPATTEVGEGQPAMDPNAAANPQENPVEYGVGLRLRNIVIPTAELELFLDRSAGGSNNVGLGFDLIRRRNTTEMRIGLEYEKLTVGEGVWIASGDNVAAGDEADWVLSPDHSGKSLSWLTIDFTFVGHSPINKNIAFLYGIGGGLGIVLGELRHYDIQCAAGSTNDSVDPGCKPRRFEGTGQYGGDSPGEEVARAYDLPPVFPVLNALVGFEFKPMDKLSISLEAGIRTLLFWGANVSYFF